MTLLKIAIPTHKPSETIKEVLQRVTTEIAKSQFQDEILLEISINQVDSCDLKVWIVDFLANSGSTYNIISNKSYLTFFENFCKLFDKRSKYTWVIGDDDLLTENCLDQVCHTLANNKYDYIHVGGYLENKFDYCPNNFSDFVTYTSFRSGGIGATIYRTALFCNFCFAELQVPYTNWPQLAYLVSQRNSLRFYCLGQQCFTEIPRSKRWIKTEGASNINKELWNVTDLKKYYSVETKSKKLTRLDLRAQKSIDRIIFNQIVLRYIKSLIKKRYDYPTRTLLRALFRC